MTDTRDTLPPLPPISPHDHPDQQTMVWMDNEIRWIKQYAEAYAAEARAPLLAEIDRLRAEAANLRTVMIAAAEEIAAHWDAHCDAEGYGPVNLLRRLEQGIPSEYGYTAGAFAKLKAECESLRAAPPGVPQGWALVPVEPTEAMEMDGMRALRTTPRTTTGASSREQAWACYRAMLAASPPAPAQEN